MNEVDKACFQHDTADGDFKDLTRRILHYKAFNITKNDGYKREFCFNSFFFFFFDKKTSNGVVKNEVIQNKELAEELHKPIIREFVEKQKVHSSFLYIIFALLILLICN